MSLRPKDPANPIVYPLAMPRLALLMATMLALAACSGSDASTSTLETSPPPQPTVGTTTTTPTPTPTPTTSPPTTPPTTEPETTTTSLEVVTPATTEPEPPVTVAGDPGVAAEQDAIFAAAFAGYQTAWNITRDAVRDPSNPELRARVSEVYVPGDAYDTTVAFLDSLLDTTERSFADPTVPNSFSLIQGLAASEDGQFAEMLMCLVLTDDVIDTATGAPTYTDTDSFVRRTGMVEVDGTWKISTESSDRKIPGASSCDT